MSQEPTAYLARAGRNGEDETTALENGLAIIGFRSVPSLEDVGSLEEMRELVATANPDAGKGKVANHASQLWAFAHSMQKGDIVVLPRKLTSQIALGRVTGPYRYQQVHTAMRHTRPVEWIRPDTPRTVFGQDLLYSFGAFMTVCTVHRNDAVRRIQAVLAGGSDPRDTPIPRRLSDASGDPAVSESDETTPDLSQLAHDQIVRHIEKRFTGHELTALVDAVLRADGWVTQVSPPGPDGGVDILAGRGSLGLDTPRLCVQVKSQATPTDVLVYRNLQGSMQTFQADQGLLVCWGGFNTHVQAAARQGHFSVRLWDGQDLVRAVYRTYEHLPPEIQAELPLKRVWMLVVEEPEE